MGNQQATQIELGWLAGIIDGEGYLGFNISRKPKGASSIVAMLHICNTDETIVLRAATIMRKLGITVYCRASDMSKYNKGNGKIVYKAQVKRQSNMILLLDAVGNNLTGNKKQRGELILEYCKSRKANHIPGKGHDFSKRELEIIEECIPLQRRGASETIRKAQLKRSEIANREKQERLTLKESKPCNYCGVKITGAPSRFIKNGKLKKNNFCSRKCYMLFQNQGKLNCEDRVRTYVRA